MNFAALFKAFDAVMAFREAAKRFSGTPAAPPAPDQGLQAQSPAAVQGLTGHLEARLTSVVIAALKEAFDRDHARLELERAQLDEERRRADAALKQELRRQTVDRELARLRLLAGGALAGWIASIAMFAAGAAGATSASRALLAAGWLLLLGALGAAFSAQGRVGMLLPELISDESRAVHPPAAAAALWLLIAGLAVTAVSFLL
jgi:hypothetical protein